MNPTYAGRKSATVHQWLERKGLQILTDNSASGIRIGVSYSSLSELIIDSYAWHFSQAALIGNINEAT
jgi:hypothetical protein